MTTSYWIVCLAAIATALVLLAKLATGRGHLEQARRWRQKLTSKEALYGRIAIILLLSGFGLTLFGIVVELLLED